MNPLLKAPNIFLYIGIWILSTIGHSVTIFYYFPDIKVAIFDGVVFNVIFGSIGLSYWYVVKYTAIDKKNLLKVLLHHYVAAIFSIFLWLLTGYLLMRYFFDPSEQYKSFFIHSIPWRMFSGKFYYIVLVLIYYLIIYYQNYQDKIVREAELQNAVKEAELNILKSQINPHFIFNSLNSISYLTMSNPEKAQEMIIKLSEFLRYSLKHNETQVTLNEEINNMFRYLDIEKTRFGSRLIVEHCIQEECKNLFIPGMILQPLLENAIKHGVYESTEPVTISLNCEKNGEYVKINIRNGYDPLSKAPKGSGIGLKNIQKRLALVYQRHDLLKINKKDKEFEVALSIPLEGSKA